MRRLLLPVLLLLGSVPFAAPAHATEIGAEPTPACPRKAGTLARELKAAEVVFTGEVTEVKGRPGRPGGQITYLVRTTAWWRGAPPETVKVFTPTTVDACGVLAPEVGQEWLFLATDVQGGVRVRSDDGSRQLTSRVSTMVEDDLGPAETFEDPVEPGFEQLTQDEPADFWPLAMPGVALVVGGLVVVAAARALGRPKGA